MPLPKLPLSLPPVMPTKSKKPHEVIQDKIPIRCRFDELMPVSKIKPHPDNPNQHPPEQLALLERVIRATGFRRPLVISRRSGLLIKGHGVLKVAHKRLKMKKVPVEYQDYQNEALEKADLVADNSVAQMSHMEDQDLVAILEEVQAESPHFDLALFGVPETLLQFVRDNQKAPLPKVPALSEKGSAKDPEAKVEGAKPVLKLPYTHAQYGRVVAALRQEQREYRLKTMPLALLHLLDRLKPSKKQKKR